MKNIISLLVVFSFPLSLYSAPSLSSASPPKATIKLSEKQKKQKRITEAQRALVTARLKFRKMEETLIKNLERARNNETKFSSDPKKESQIITHKAKIDGNFGLIAAEIFLQNKDKKQMKEVTAESLKGCFRVQDVISCTQDDQKGVYQKISDDPKLIKAILNIKIDPHRKADYNKFIQKANPFQDRFKLDSC